MTAVRKHGPWALVGALGAAALAVVATQRGESINALWIVVAAVSVYLIAYRYYSLYIADRIMRLDPTRQTPAVRHNDGLDYVPPTSTSCSATISRRSRVPARWSARCWPPRWATCRACCGSCPAWCWPEPCRTSWCCSSRCAATAARSAS